MLCKRPRKGFTVAELLISAFIFGILLTVLTVTAVKSFRVFQLSTERHNAQAELRRFASSFIPDARRSNGHLCGILERSLDVGHRDSVSFVGLSNWQSDSSYNAATQFPNWDRYIVYFSNQKGELARAELRAEGNSPLRVPFPELALLTDKVGTTKLPDLEKCTRFSTDLSNFDVSLDATGAVRVELGLQALHTELMIFPQNTWPEV